jgi:hypothetical protein
LGEGREGKGRLMHKILRFENRTELKFIKTEIFGFMFGSEFSETELQR